MGNLDEGLEAICILQFRLNYVCDSGFRIFILFFYKNAYVHHQKPLFFDVDDEEAFKSNYYFLYSFHPQEK